MHQEIFLTYLYCFCDKAVTLPPSGFERSIELLPVGNHFAVIENVSTKEFSESALQSNMSDMNWLLPKVNLHESVAQDLMEKTTILPIKFATIFSSEANLQELYNSNKNNYEENFSKLQHKQEWGVKVYSGADESWLLERTDDEEIKQAKALLETASPGKAFLMKKKIKSLINKKKTELNKALGTELYQAIKTGSFESLQKSILPAQSNDSNEKKLILNGVFLLEETEVKPWLEHLEQVEKSLENNEIVFDVTGPWPPYHFVN